MFHIIIHVNISFTSVCVCFRALEDIEESIKELKYYRQVVFKTCK